MQRHLVILVRVPQIGAVKTRLAAGIGRLAAWRFYRNTTDQVIRRLARHGASGGWKIWLAVTPEAVAGGTGFWPASIQGQQLGRIGQGRGNIGQRMAKPMLDLPPGPVVVIGSDIPEIQARHIKNAFVALEKKQVVLGPAADGGYWLVGLRRRPCPPGRLRPALFGQVRWSTAHALEDTLAGLDRRYSVAHIDRLQDVDDQADYDDWRLRPRRPA